MTVRSPVERNAASAEKELLDLLAECDTIDVNNTHLPIVLNNLAVCYHALRRFDQAHALYQKSRAIWQQALGAGHPRVAQSLNNLAAYYRERERYTEAEALFQTALAIWNQAGWPLHETTTLGSTLDRDTLAQVPLWADQPRSVTSGHYLVNYRDSVQRLKAGDRSQ